MSYQKAIERLFSMVPELYVSGNAPRKKFSLEQIRILLSRLGNPHCDFPAVLIAGTNGKGSTASTLGSILTRSGYRTGLYTSPHLVRVNERMRIDGQLIPDESFGRIFDLVDRAASKAVEAGELPSIPSFFELLTAMAFCWFSEQKIDIAVLEVGLGGRLDATNVVDPLLSVITDISLDHTEWLGPTRAAIAGEKAGILRMGGTLVRLTQNPEVDRVLDAAVDRLQARDVVATDFLPAQESAGSYELVVLGQRIAIQSPLAGAHQRRNVALAIRSAVELHGRFGLDHITPESIAQGIATTDWPGRMEQMVWHGKQLLLDVAHNPAGAEALLYGMNTVMRYKASKVLIFSCLRDKAVVEITRTLFPAFDRVILVPIASPRAASLTDLASAAASAGVLWEIAESVEAGLSRALDCHTEWVVVSGSVYLVGEVRHLMEQLSIRTRSSSVS